MKHVVDLTCCRALFAAWVFAYHMNLQTHYADALGPLGSVVERGSLGVDGFFILSGMILAHAHPHLAPTLSEARLFWAKRLVRIYPVHLAMIVALAMMIGVAALLHLHPREPGRFGLEELASHLALLHAWGASDRWAWNYPSWSISAEWAGYLLFPFLWALLRGQNGIGVRVVLPVTLLGVVGARAWGHAEGLSLTFDGGLLRFFPEFIAGIAIVPLLGQLPQRLPAGATAVGAGVAVLVAAGFGADGMPAEVGTTVALWVLLAAMMLTAQRGAAPVLGRVPGLRWLGELSYSYYMSFALIETLQATVWRHFDVSPFDRPLLYIVSSTAMTLLVATASWGLVERPALRAFGARGQRARARLAVPARG